MVPALAAGTRAGTAFASARSSTSTMRCEVSTLPPATGAGGRASTMLPGGVTNVSGRRMPAVAGASYLSRGTGEVDVQRCCLGVEAQADGDAARDVGHAIVIEPVFCTEVASGHGA